MTERIGYDELLAARVKQLQLIRDRIGRILSVPDGGTKWIHELVSLENEIADMIREAEAEHSVGFCQQGGDDLGATIAKAIDAWEAKYGKEPEPHQCPTWVANITIFKAPDPKPIDPVAWLRAEAELWCDEPKELILRVSDALEAEMKDGAK